MSEKKSSRMQSSSGGTAAESQGPKLRASKPEEVPGEKPAMLSTRILEGTAATLQSFKPINNFAQHICTWAMYSQDPSRKIQTHHFASRLSEEVVQCIVFDSPEANARIIGVEYIISDNLFGLLPEEEKKLWHSHAYEISEGLWVNPGVPEAMQQAEAKRLVNTYGKFWNTWQFDRGDKLPLGPPALMVSPQAHPSGTIPGDLIDSRDKQMGVNTAEKHEARGAFREELKGKPRDACADWWERSGEGWMTLIKPIPLELDSAGEGPVAGGKEVAPEGTSAGLTEEGAKVALGA